jgi:hypothetical protein
VEGSSCIKNRFEWVVGACCVDEFLVPHWGGLREHLRSRGNWSEVLSYASFHDRLDVYVKGRAVWVVKLIERDVRAVRLSGHYDTSDTDTSVGIGAYAAPKVDVELDNVAHREVWSGVMSKHVLLVFESAAVAAVA